MNAVAAFLLVVCYLAESHAFQCEEAPSLLNIQQVDAGWGQVIAIDEDMQAYILNGDTWDELGSNNFTHVSAGISGTWGTDTDGLLHTRAAGEWKPVIGHPMRQVDAGGPLVVVGLTTNNLTTCETVWPPINFASGSVSFFSTPTANSFAYISCGILFGCWAVDQTNQVYISQSIPPGSCLMPPWTNIPGQAMTMIEVSTDGRVFGVGTDGKVYERDGINASNKFGSQWIKIPMCLPISHVSYDNGHLWAVSTSGLLLTCTDIK